MPNLEYIALGLTQDIRHSFSQHGPTKAGEYFLSIFYSLFFYFLFFAASKQGPGLATSPPGLCGQDKKHSAQCQSQSDCMIYRILPAHELRKNNKILTHRNRWKAFSGLIARHVESPCKFFSFDSN